MHLIMLPFALILFEVFPIVVPLSMYLIITEFPFVEAPIFECNCTDAMLFPTLPLPIISLSIWPFYYAHSFWFIVLPITFVP